MQSAEYSGGIRPAPERGEVREGPANLLRHTRLAFFLCGWLSAGTYRESEILMRAGKREVAKKAAERTFGTVSTKIKFS